MEPEEREVLAIPTTPMAALAAVVAAATMVVAAAVAALVATLTDQVEAAEAAGLLTSSRSPFAQKCGEVGKMQQATGSSSLAGNE